MDEQRTLKQIDRLERAFDDVTIDIAHLCKSAKGSKSARTSERYHVAIAKARLSLSGILDVVSLLRASLPAALPDRPTKVIPIKAKAG